METFVKNFFFIDSSDSSGSDSDSDSSSSSGSSSHSRSRDRSPPKRSHHTEKLINKKNVKKGN